jgi:anti-anti-sigma regulatory factor
MDPANTEDRSALFRAGNPPDAARAEKPRDQYSFRFKNKAMGKQCNPAAISGTKMRDMTKFDIKQVNGSGVLAFDGELTVKHGKEAREALIRALAEVDYVIINVESVTEIDTSCLQLFCSAHRTAERMKKKINLNGTLPDCLKEALKVAGYDRRTGCGFDHDCRCLWIAR